MLTDCMVSGSSRSTFSTRRALVELEAKMDAELETTLCVRRRRTVFDDEPPERQGSARAIQTTLLTGAEATFRRDTGKLENLTCIRAARDHAGARQPRARRAMRSAGVGEPTIRQR